MVGSGPRPLTFHGFIELRVDDSVVWIPDHVHGVQALLHFANLSFEHLPQHGDTSVGSGQMLAGPVRDGTLSFPSHEVLGIYVLHRIPGKWVHLIRGFLEGTFVFNGKPFFLFHYPPVIAWDEMDIDDPGVSIIYGNSNLGPIGLPEYVGKDQWMLLNLSVSKGPRLHDTVGQFGELKLF